ncbi:hypothetical protein CEXT_142031 [Caerostris extrusa]|uniref:Secreted protein n=1 Tax=Caerostris extrusa TaxID=172846 RepID=A0AAV4XES2_CAEEX|nr:hypothetical protein CEXT_142031 [Caerostris extrusa]
MRLWTKFRFFHVTSRLSMAVNAKTLQVLQFYWFLLWHDGFGDSIEFPNFHVLPYAVFNRTIRDHILHNVQFSNTHQFITFLYSTGKHLTYSADGNKPLVWMQVQGHQDVRKVNHNHNT